ncbi:DUF4350 domain-containing protein [Streptomyces lycii]|uniref:DUF4350 domain-containing protein n=1 Tax=Streptomyces lycii TaxID=2654337 RepID=A0ABQ7FGV8_9ACTN|nr:DUF4350 domain-containing protein [Streptomyces lycii]KAF4408147.1 DUF4350 domain-containing protein [Streptomyces lycii]
MTGPATTGSPTSATAHQLWTRSRGLLVALAVLVLAGIVLAVLRSGDQHGRLDPRSPDRYGTRAVAQLLADRGVTTRVVTSTDAAVEATGPSSTLVVTEPDRLTDRQQRLLQDAAGSAGRAVLLSPGPASVGVLAPGVRASGPAGATPRSPDCDFAPARRAGDADVGGIRYASDDPDAASCYLSDDLPSLLRVPGPRGRDTVLLGSPDILYNDRLAENGNASLALQLLGSHPEVVWYLPSLSDTAASDGGDRGFLDLVPEGWIWGTAQLAVAAALAALWRARRLGPISPERLPVAVRASEATEGRARLYQQANARDRASETLRSATRARIAPFVGVPPSHAHRPDLLSPAVTPHLPEGTTEVTDLLFGSVPPTDAALVRLADELDALEHRITSTSRASGPPPAPPEQPSSASPASPPPAAEPPTSTERDSTS